MFLFRQSGLKQSELTTLKEGLARELSALPKDFVWNDPPRTREWTLTLQINSKRSFTSKLLFVILVWFSHLEDSVVENISR